MCAPREFMAYPRWVDELLAARTADAARTLITLYWPVSPAEGTSLLARVCAALYDNDPVALAAFDASDDLMRRFPEGGIVAAVQQARLRHVVPFAPTPDEAVDAARRTLQLWGGDLHPSVPRPDGLHALAAAEGHFGPLLDADDDAWADWAAAHDPIALLPWPDALTDAFVPYPNPTEAIWARLRQPITDTMAWKLLRALDGRGALQEEPDDPVRTLAWAVMHCDAPDLAVHFARAPWVDGLSHAAAHTLALLAARQALVATTPDGAHSAWRHWRTVAYRRLGLPDAAYYIQDALQGIRPARFPLPDHLYAVVAGLSDIAFRDAHEAGLWNASAWKTLRDDIATLDPLLLALRRTTTARDAFRIARTLPDVPLEELTDDFQQRVATVAYAVKQGAVEIDAIDRLLDLLPDVGPPPSLQGAIWATIDRLRRPTPPAIARLRDMVPRSGLHEAVAHMAAEALATVRAGVPDFGKAAALARRLVTMPAGAYRTVTEIDEFPAAFRQSDVFAALQGRRRPAPDE